MLIVASIPRNERRLMKKAIHKMCDKAHARRLSAMLILHQSTRIGHVVSTLCCACSPISR